jgi:hypothetical protein
MGEEIEAACRLPRDSTSISELENTGLDDCGLNKALRSLSGGLCTDSRVAVMIFMDNIPKSSSLLAAVALWQASF